MVGGFWLVRVVVWLHNKRRGEVFRVLSLALVLDVSVESVVVVCAVRDLHKRYYLLVYNYYKLAVRNIYW